MGCISIVFGLGFLLIGIASVAILVKIGGGSDGPGALVFYIGAFLGLGGAWAIFTSGPKGD
jgi:hypothetical protein